jgi:hypothetical protein
MQGRKGTAAAETIAERAAQNQSTFRDANERIEAAAQRLEDIDPVPLICECPERGCTALIQVELAAYEAVRDHGDRFLVAAGHEVTELDGVRIARVVVKDGRYTIMEKVGHAGTVARELDPRSPPSPDR